LQNQKLRLNKYSKGFMKNKLFGCTLIEIFRHNIFNKHKKLKTR